MKNLKGFCVTLFLLLSLGVNAQFTAGFKGGVNLANQTFEGAETDTLNTRGITGAVAGVVLEYSFGDRFALQSELNFLQKGSEIVSELIDGSIDFSRTSTEKFGYFEIPLLAKAKFGKENLHLFALVGPSLGLALNGEKTETTRLNGTTLKETEIVDFEKEGIKRLEISAVAGLGVALGSESLKLFVDGRYLFGLTELENKDDGVSIKNRGINLTAGLLFSF